MENEIKYSQGLILNLQTYQLLGAWNLPSSYSLLDKEAAQIFAQMSY